MRITTPRVQGLQDARVRVAETGLMQVFPSGRPTRTHRYGKPILEKRGVQKSVGDAGGCRGQERVS